MTKKVIILDKPKGCRLANQLWNYISIYAYSLGIKAKCINLCFYENKKDQITGKRSYDNYYKYFNIPGHQLISLMISLHIIINKINSKPRIINRYLDYIKRKNKDLIIQSGEKKPFYLNKKIKKNQKKLYFDGWLFRNPEGIKKYRKEIINYFQPQNKIKRNINYKIKELRSTYNHIIGVHIRKGDYKVFDDGKLYLNDKEVNKILNEYLEKFKKNKEKTCFLICSDEKINLNNFPGLNILQNKGNLIEDLFILAKTDIIIGSNSTFGAFASYYGNIPLIVFQKPEINWNYYMDKNNYFENKYLTMLHF